jgi:hypothetical protein
MKSKPRKLTLSRETVRALEDRSLSRVGGGDGSSGDLPRPLRKSRAAAADRDSAAHPVLVDAILRQRACRRAARHGSDAMSPEIAVCRDFASSPEASRRLRSLRVISPDFATFLQTSRRFPVQRDSALDFATVLRTSRRRFVLRDVFAHIATSPHTSRRRSRTTAHRSGQCVVSGDIVTHLRTSRQIWRDRDRCGGLGRSAGGATS